MILTQHEARLLSEILKGFSEGKHYQYPANCKIVTVPGKGQIMVPKEWAEITDYDLNKDIPTISLTFKTGELIPPDMISEKK